MIWEKDLDKRAEKGILGTWDSLLPSEETYCLVALFTDINTTLDVYHNVFDIFSRCFSSLLEFSKHLFRSFKLYFHQIICP